MIQKSLGAVFGDEFAGEFVSFLTTFTALFRSLNVGVGEMRRFSMRTVPRARSPLFASAMRHASSPFKSGCDSSALTSAGRLRATHRSPRGSVTVHCR